MNGSAEIAWGLTNTRSTLGPLDVALEYLRRRPERVIGPYLLAMTPFTVAVFRLIDVIATQQRSALAPACWGLAICTVWRWGWLVVLQRRVQTDLRGEPPLPLPRRLPHILLTRLAAHFLLTWGGLLIFPPFYGLYLSGFAAPAILEKQTEATAQIRTALLWTHQAAGRLGKIALALFVLLLLALLATFVAHVFLTQTVLTSFLGMETADMSVTLTSISWWLSVLYFIFLAFDFYWSTASVFLFYDLQAGRLGSDLRLRLKLLSEGRA